MSGKDFNLDKFIKLMMMTTSQHDNEALSALRLANAELTKIDVNWDQVIRGRVQINVAAPIPTAPAPNTNPAHHREPHIDEWFDVVLFAGNASPSFTEFLNDMHQWWKEKKFLTEKQYRALENSVAIANNPRRPRTRRRYY